MAVARVGSPVVGGGSGPVSSKTFSFTATGGANNFLVVDVGYYDSSTNATAAVTYNGVAMTLIGRKAATSVTKNNSESYGLINPPAGTHDVVITFSAGGQYVACGAQEYSGVDALTPTENVTSAEGINTTGSNSLVVSSATDDYAHFVSIHTYGITTSSYACTNDELYTSTITASTIIGAARDAAGAATVTFAATWTAGGFGGGWSQLGFSIKAGSPVSILSGTATLGDITASGTLATAPLSSLSGSANLGDISASGTLGVAPGVITTPVLKNNTGTILASVSGVVANVYHPTTGALVVRKTGLSSDGSGIVTITDALLVPGTSYVYEIDLSAASLGRRLPVGIAA